MFSVSARSPQSIDYILQVYKGKWRGLVVAVKILTSKDLVQQDQFREETKLLESLRHPHIVNYLGHIFEDDKEVSKCM